MDLWFSETFEESLRPSWKVKEVLYQQRSIYQDVVVIDTDYFGRMLVLDGCVMTTERDEFVYHEMLTHPGLLAHSNPKSVVVIGGGDGGTVREVLKHPSVDKVVLAEIDGDVVDVCRRFFPNHTRGLSDQRVSIEIGDGFDYLKRHPNEFDAVLSDSTDPIGPGAVLFEDDYFRLVKASLRPGGYFVTQAHGLWSKSNILVEARKKLLQSFNSVLWYGAPIPTYPNGYWSFLLASDGLDPKKSDVHRVSKIAATTEYFSEAMQQSAFVMPNFLSRRFAQTRNS